MTINNNSFIDTPVEVLVAVLCMFVVIIALCKLGNALEKLPVADPKAKAKKKETVKEVKKDIKKEVKKEVVKEVKEEVVEKEKKVSSEETTKSTTTTTTNDTSSTVTNTQHGAGCSCGGAYICPYSNMIQQVPVQNNSYVGYDNYLHDRFSVYPSSIDYVEDKKISESFLSEEELSTIRDSNIRIKVNDVDSGLGGKENLYKRISQMTNHNQKTREKLLEEFEGLSREMKLLIIDNIIQKM